MPFGVFQRGGLWWRFLVICGLSAAAVAGPVLDIYGRNPDVFVANRTSGPEIVLFGLIITFGVPILATTVIWLAEKLSVRAGDVVFLTLVVFLSMATGFVVSRQVFPESTVLGIGSALVVAAIVLGLLRWFGGAFGYFALALPIILVLFVATSASARLIWESPQSDAEVNADIGDSVPIVFIQLDEMPVASIMDLDGTVNETLFPNFARLAREGTWYRNALSNSIATTQSIPAILTGKVGEKGMSPSSVDHPKNLFNLLSGTYEMHVIEWIADMCPEEVCPDYAGRAPARFTSLLRDVSVVYGHLTLPAGLREDLPSIENAWKGFLGDGDVPAGSGVEIRGLPVPDHGERVEWVDWIQRLIDGMERNSPATLHYAHLEAPHVPWKTNPSGTHYERPEEYTEVEGVGGDGRWASDPRPALIGFQRHLFQTGFLDKVLGRLFGQLDDTGSWERSLIVVVADHGASFVAGEHRRWPYENNRDDLYRIPLFIKYPGQAEGQVVDTPVYGIDILPTIVDALDIETDWEFDGVSLLGSIDPARPHEPIWWCCSAEGVSTDLDVLFDQVRRNHLWVPDQASWPAVAGSGPHASLVGDDAGSMDVTETGDVRWSLDLGSTLSNVRSADGFVQTFLTGRMELPSSGVGDELLVVINGRVAGTGYLLRDSATGGVFRALISEELVNDGHNDVELLVASSGGGWLAGSSDVLTLELSDAEGRILELVDEGRRRVQVDEVAVSSEGWVIEGWAADVTQKLTPDRVFVFVGDTLIDEGPADEENRNVVRWFESDELLLSGFSFNIPASLVPDGVDQLTVVAEFGDVAVADPVTLPALTRG